MKRTLTVLRLLVILCFTPVVALSQTDLKNISSSDIIAEVDFLNSIMPQMPMVRLANPEERAFLDYFSSYGICQGWDFEEYSKFVSTFEEEFRDLFAGRPFYIKLSKTSYESTAENGCQVNDKAKQVVEDVFGDFERYLENMQIKGRIIEAIDARSKEMLRRTIGASE